MFIVKFVKLLLRYYRMVEILMQRISAMPVKLQHDLADVFVHCFPYILNIVNACQIQAIRNIMSIY